MRVKNKLKVKGLPSKPSRLIRAALKDLAKCETSPRFQIDMSDWMTKRWEDNVCSICLAGAMMAQRLPKIVIRKMKPYDSIYPEQTEQESKLRALNAFREGDIRRGLAYLYIERPRLKAHMEIPLYWVGSPLAFHKGMEKMAKYLEKRGL
jgi:hypothetical protein